MKNYKIGLLFVALSLIITVFLLQNCNKPTGTSNNVSYIVHPYQFPDISWFPTKMNIPGDNPTTIEGVRLGRYLFYDGRWSGRFAQDSQMTCGTCHLQKHSFICGMDHPKFIGGHPFGVTGVLTSNYMLPLVNLVYNFNGYTWNGEINDNNPSYGDASMGVPSRLPYSWKNIEAVPWLALYLPDEMASDSVHALAALRSITSPNYKSLFKAAFGTTEINMDRIEKSIAQFVRTLISYQSKYDSVVHMHRAYFSPAEARGFQDFMTEAGDCFHCHGEPSLLTNNLFMNNGLDTIDAVGDRYSFTNDSVDIGAFKVPTLRNITVRGPFMRNGCFTTLEQVLDYYATGVNNTKHTNPLMKWAFQGGNHLSDGQKQDLIIFLKTLTDYKFLSDTAFAKPSDLP